METEWRQENINDSDEGSSEKHLLCNGFHAILHDNVHERLMAFLSMLCRCIFKNITDPPEWGEVNWENH